MNGFIKASGTLLKDGNGENFWGNFFLCDKKKSSYSYYTREALNNVGGDVVLFAEKEGFTAHAKSVSKRMAITKLPG
jgi:hypothetical protein